MTSVADAPMPAAAPAPPALPVLSPAPASPEGAPTAARPPTPPKANAKRGSASKRGGKRAGRPRRKEAVLMGRLTYRWAVVRKPNGSRLRAGTITGVRKPMGWFKPDVPGIYDLALHVRGHGHQYVDPVRIRVLGPDEEEPKNDEFCWRPPVGKADKDDKESTPVKDSPGGSQASAGGSSPEASPAGSPAKPVPAPLSA